VQLASAVQDRRVFKTANCDDFGDLHDLIMVCGGFHPGILVIRTKNDHRRDRQPKHIVPAIANIVAFLETTSRGLLMLNEWQRAACTGFY
jgi:hypothetical protein